MGTSGYHVYSSSLGPSLTTLSPGRWVFAGVDFGPAGLIAARPGAVSVVGTSPTGSPAPLATIDLDPGIDVAAVDEIPSDDGSDIDVLVVDRAAGRLLRLHRTAVGWQSAGSLPAGVAPAALAARFRIGLTDPNGQNGFAVTDAASNQLWLYQRSLNGALVDAGQRTTGARPVAVAASYFGDLGDVLVSANADAGTVTILHGAEYADRLDVVVGAQPVALAPLMLNAGSAVGPALAIANAGSASISVVAPAQGGARVLTTVPLPGSRPVALAAGRLDRDKAIDLAVADAATDRLLILHGDGMGGFRVASALPLSDDPAGVVVMQLGDDEVDDIAVAGRRGTLSVFISAGDEIMDEHVASAIAAGGGQIMWSARDDDGYHLVVRQSGRQYSLPIAPAAAPIQARLGTGPTGRPAASYARCTKNKCVAYRYDFDRGAERGLAAVRVPARCTITAVATERRTMAYVVDGRLGGCARRSVGLWIGSGRGFRRVSSARVIRLAALTSRFVGWTEWRGHNLAIAAVILADLRTRRRATIARFNAGDVDLGWDITGPLIDGHSLYWASYADSSLSGSDSAVYHRVGLKRKRCERSVDETDDGLLGVPGDWNETRVDFAVQRGQLYYVWDDHAFAADMSRLTALRCGT